MHGINQDRIHELMETVLVPVIVLLNQFYFLMVEISVFPGQ